MAFDITAIRKAVAANARTAVGVNDTKHYRPDAPSAGVTFWVEVVSYEASTFGRQRWTVTLEGHLSVQGGWDRSQQEKLDELVPLVWAALETDRTLAGRAQTMTVLAVQWLEEAEGLGARFDITVEV